MDVSRRINSPANASSNERYPELDALRGIAVLLMVLYHLAFDLAFFYGWDIPVLSGAWKLLARTSATTFLLLIGICFVISWHRASTAHNVACHPERSRAKRGAVEGQAATLCSAQHDRYCFLSLYKKYLRRGCIIFSGGMLISLATWLIVPHAYVRFGILHLIGVAALLQPFFTPLKSWNVFVAAVFLVLLYLFNLYNFYNLYNPSPLPAFLAIPLGLPSPGFLSLDYYPLIPWFGVILMGMAVGNLYIPRPRNFLHSLGNLPYPPLLLGAGRYSLWIYFVHQPFLLLLLGLIFGMPVQ